MFIGTSDGTEVLAVGGKFYVDKTNSAIEIATAAFNTANAAGSSDTALAAFAKANSANIVGSSAFDKANSANIVGSSAFDKANTVQLIANTSFDKANSANVLAFNNSLIASAGFDKANSANVLAFNTSVTSSAAFNKANSAETIAIAAYANSNSKFSSSGGTITGDVNIVGNLTLSGNTSFINVSSFVVNDPLIYLAANNYFSDIVDIGFIGSFSNATGANVYTGLYREHTNKEYYLFQGYDKQIITDNHIGALSNNMTLSVLNADIRTSNLNLGGQNTITWITSSFDKANSANLLAYNSGITGSAAFDKANSANVLAFNTGVTSSAAFDKANSANINAANATFLTTGIVAIGVGGTGVTSFTSNGILYGNTGGPLKVTSAGTEGQVLQAGSTGVPAFGHLDGGNF
jgi:hypothetical protein